MLLLRSHLIKKVLSVMTGLESSAQRRTMKDDYMVSMFAVGSKCDIEWIIREAVSPPMTIIAA